MCYTPNMNLEARHEALISFLLPYQDIWKNEIMLQYPNSLDGYPMAWIEELMPWVAPEKTLQLTYDQGWDTLSAELSAFHQQTQTLCSFPQLTATRALPTTPDTWVKIIPKKQHELERLAPILAEFIKVHRLNDVVDIGGGLGHLAQTLAHHYHLPVLSLDMDEKLQTAGLRWQAHKWPNSRFPVRYQTHRIDHHDQAFIDLLRPNTLTTGLHTCGGLAVAHLKAAQVAGSALANMGCCYHKLETSETNLSQASKERPLPWGLYSLTLASGAHHKVSLDDIIFRNQVKRFRYILHFLLHDHFGITTPVKLGNADPKSYVGSFADYTREQLSRLNLNYTGTDKALEDFRMEESRQLLVEQMLAAALIRDQFGRVLESALLVDRALWMKDQGHQVEIGEIFDAKVSPRNLILLSWKN